MLVLATIVAGGYVAGTEKEGTPGEPVVGQAHVACGTGCSADMFPACNGQFPGFGQSRLADIQLVHRALMYLAAIAVLAMAAIALAPPRAEPRLRARRRCCSSARSRSGSLNVWAGKHAGLIVGHLALGTVLWSTVVYAGATLLPVPEPAAAAAPPPRGRGSGDGLGHTRWRAQPQPDDPARPASSTPAAYPATYACRAGVRSVSWSPRFATTSR